MKRKPAHSPVQRIAYAAVSVAIAQSAGLIGTVFTVSAIPTWYRTLDKPVFAPPNWVFAPVWTILYTLMGIASFLIWEKRDRRDVRDTLLLYAAHLALNALWSVLFFGLENPGLAFIEIVLMWVTLGVTMIRFHRIKPLAAYLLVPYLLWVSFAAILNFGIWLLNY